MLAGLGARIFAATFGPANTPENMRAYLGSAFSVDQVRAELQDDASATLIAEQGAPVGYARLRAGAVPEGVPRGAIELVRMYVDHTHHGSGVAAALMEASVALARERGHRAMYLGVWEHNPRAQAFYRKWGFRQTGTHTFMLGDDVQTDWLLVRAL